MNLATTLLSSVPERVRTEIGSGQDFINEIYDTGLFTIKIGATWDAPPKFKTRETRDAAFELLLALSRNSWDNYLRTLELIKFHHQSKRKKVNSWEYHPGANVKGRYGYVGIDNLGATCYMSAVLQQFFMMPDLRKGIFHVPFEQKGGEANDSSVLFQLQCLFAYLGESEKRSYNPVSFCKTFVKSHRFAISYLTQTLFLRRNWMADQLMCKFSKTWASSLPFCVTSWRNL